MKQLKTYGPGPFRVCLLHGGPGAAGEMGPVAARLYRSDRGILEPFQTDLTISGQVEQLKRIIEARANPPVVLAGFSWGAWLSLIFGAIYPELAAKLILISSGPLEGKYAKSILTTRLARLSPPEQAELEADLEKLGDKNTSLEFKRRLSALIFKADSFQPAQYKPESGFDPVVYDKIWPEAERLRSQGQLVETAARVRCPVFAIHGDCDPHPAAGVIEPLSKTVEDFSFTILKDCGHYPWLEVKARDRFFEVLNIEIDKALV